MRAFIAKSIGLEGKRDAVSRAMGLLMKIVSDPNYAVTFTQNYLHPRLLFKLAVAFSFHNHKHMTIPNFRR